MSEKVSPRDAQDVLESIKLIMLSDGGRFQSDQTFMDWYSRHHKELNDVQARKESESGFLELLERLDKIPDLI